MVRESRRDGIYGNNGLQSIGRDKHLMLTWASPVGMGHIVAMDFSPLAVGMGHIVAMDFSPLAVGMGYIVTMDFSPLAVRRSC